jgi:type I restriction enzyme S subunit
MREKWETYKLGEICDDVAMGPFGSNLKVDNFIDKGVPVIRGMNLNDGGFTNNSFAFVSEEKANSLKRCLAYPDDLVFTHRGTLGQVAIIPKDGYEKYLVSQSQMRLTVNKRYLSPKYLYYFFKSPLGQKELLKNSSQVGVPAIANPTKSLKEVEIAIPDLKTQDEITSIFTSLDAKIELNLQMNQTL